MGYYTNFSITIKVRMTRAMAEFICERINELIGWEQFSVYAGNSPLMEERDSWKFEPYGELKWYDWEDHMAMLAHQFNKVEFRVEGIGEDKGDWWVALFKGDKKQIRYCSPPVDYWEN